jgi:hypothetical protein
MNQSNRSALSSKRGASIDHSHDGNVIPSSALELVIDDFSAT